MGKHELKKPLLPIKGQLTKNQEMLLLSIVGLLILFFWILAGIGFWTVWGWLK